MTDAMISLEMHANTAAGNRRHGRKEQQLIERVELPERFMHKMSDAQGNTTDMKITKGSQFSKKRAFDVT